MPRFVVYVRLVFRFVCCVHIWTRKRDALARACGFTVVAYNPHDRRVSLMLCNTHFILIYAHRKNTANLV